MWALTSKESFVNYRKSFLRMVDTDLSKKLLLVSDFQHLPFPRTYPETPPTYNILQNQSPVEPTINPAQNITIAPATNPNNFPSS